MKIAKHEDINRNVLKTIEDIKTIIFAVRESLKITRNPEYRKVYIQEINEREEELKELQLCLMQ